MNVLIVGFGIAGKFYFNLLKNKKNIKKIFVCDNINLPKHPKLQKIPFDINKIKKNKINYAFVATPSHLHFKYSQVLLKNSINLVIEKPFVLRLSHANQLIKLSKTKKVKCWVAFQNRYNLAIQALKKLIIKKTLGNIFLVDCSLVWKRDVKYYKVSWRGKYKSDGGVLTNQAIHLLDALIYTFGEIKKFNSIIEHNKKKLQAEDLAVINLIHKNNLISTLKATTRADSNYRSSMDIIGEKGRALVKGISLNTFHLLKENRIFDIEKKSENFEIGGDAVGAMGTGHSKILKEFLNKKIKKSSKGLEIHKNLHVLKVIHSIYNQKKDLGFSYIKSKQSKLGV